MEPPKNSQFSIDQANACSKMLTLGIACKQSLLSLTRICLNSQFSILNSQFNICILPI